MDCVFDCTKPLEAYSMPICAYHLEKFGLHLTMLPNLALIESPRGLTSFLVAGVDHSKPPLIFKLSGTQPHKQTRSIYLPTFRVNDVIVHNLKFTDLTGSNRDCATVAPLNIAELERLRSTDAHNQRVDAVLQNQARAESILSQAPNVSPVASQMLIDTFQEYPQIMASNVFSMKTEAAENVPAGKRLFFSIDYPQVIANMMGTTYNDFNQKNSIWYAIVYHIFPEEIKSADQTVHLSLTPNCELKKDYGLVALSDIFNGQMLVLKDKKMTLQEMMCYLGPTNETVIPVKVQARK